MRKSFELIMINFFLFVITVAYAYQPALEGAAWQSQSASTKLKTLWSNIQKDTSPASWYTLSMAELFTEDLELTFSSVSDDMPSQGLLNSKRKKLIHSVGAVAHAKWVSRGSHNYTGIFSGGCANTLVRFSLAKEPDDGKHPNIVPGMAVKFLRDGLPSVNTFAMFSLQGQSSFNMFEHDWSSHPPSLNPKAATLPENKLNERFATVTEFSVILGLSEVAQYTQEGQLVSTPRFPFRLQFHPVYEVHTKFPSAPQKGNKFFVSQLESLQPGPLFDVYAQATPFSEDLELIGSLSLVVSPTGSEYGDRTLFHQHTFFERDLVFHPEWRNATLAIMEKQSTTPGGFTYPDLPWNSTALKFNAVQLV